MILDDVKVVVGSSARRIDLALTGPGHSFRAVFAAPTGNVLGPGVYEDAMRATYGASDTPGLDVFGDHRACGPLSGRFIIDEIFVDHDGIVQWLSVRFEQHCYGSDPGLFGAVAYYGTAPYRTRSITPDRLDFGVQPPRKPGRPEEVRVTNEGPSSLAIETVAVTGPDAQDFEVTSDGCTGETLAAGQGCSVHVRFRAGSGGEKSASLTVFDDLAPVGGSGRDIPLSGTARVGPD